jgi:hypothetical protein
MKLLKHLSYIKLKSMLGKKSSFSSIGKDLFSEYITIQKSFSAYHSFHIFNNHSRQYNLYIEEPRIAFGKATSLCQAITSSDIMFKIFNSKKGTNKYEIILSDNVCCQTHFIVRTLA